MLSILSLVVSAGMLASQPTSAAGSAAPGTIPPKIETFLRESEELRRGTIVRLEQQLRQLRSQSPDMSESRHLATKLTADLEALRSKKEPLVPALRFPPEVGAIGRLPRASAHVEQVMSETRMLVRCDFSLKVRAVRNFQARYETVVRPVTFLVEGLPTRKDQEASDLELPQAFEITGTHTYQTVSGRANTVFVLREFDLKAVEPYLQAVSGRR